jgi:hypothetical protein
MYRWLIIILTMGWHVRAEAAAVSVGRDYVLARRARSNKV